jgi:hypothetical protein
VYSIGPRSSLTCTGSWLAAAPTSITTTSTSPRQTGDDDDDENSTTHGGTRRKKKKKSKSHVKGALTVRVIAARGLAAGGTDGVSDPFCEISIRDSHNVELGEGKVTKTKKKTFDPEWNETFTL